MIAEKLYNGLTTTAIGITTVFCVLILLWGMVELMRIAMSKIEDSDNEQKPVTQVVVETVSDDVVAGNDNEIVAAISAAIAVYLDAPQNSFRIKSFKRVGSNFKR